MLSNGDSIYHNKIDVVFVHTQGLFSATQTDEVEALVRAGLRNPVRITVREKYSKSKVCTCMQQRFALCRRINTYLSSSSP